MTDTLEATTDPEGTRKLGKQGGLLSPVTVQREDAKQEEVAGGREGTGKGANGPKGGSSYIFMPRSTRATPVLGAAGTTNPLLRFLVPVVVRDTECNCRKIESNPKVSLYIGLNCINPRMSMLGRFNSIIRFVYLYHLGKNVTVGNTNAAEYSTRKDESSMRNEAERLSLRDCKSIRQVRIPPPENRSLRGLWKIWVKPAYTPVAPSIKRFAPDASGHWRTRKVLGVANTKHMLRTYAALHLRFAPVTAGQTVADEGGCLQGVGVRCGHPDGNVQMEMDNRGIAHVPNRCADRNDDR
ncbi:hypothetical protein WN51_09523 [Melipona quadrifasciata]|uniref:Uncharacterized protein n=1 Tax=Melipona quadrifasciata TaxID=166423 RepID=A0A0N0BIZ2_9HYME|nr:hypothetical protein WN51_09523 [Melipona quadrifasciata]